MIELHVPPLRQRIEDLPELINLFLSQLAHRNGQPINQIAPSAIEALSAYEFPGNVRELENILERAITLCDGQTIHVSDLQLSPQLLPQFEVMKSGPAAMSAENPELASGAITDKPIEASQVIPTQLNPYLDNTEKQAIIKALEETRYNKTAAARRLGITFRALRYRLKKYGIT